MTQICKAQISSICQAETAISILMGCPWLKDGRSEHLPSVISSTEISPCSGLFLITGQSQVRFKQHFSNRCISVRKEKGCSVPPHTQLPIAQRHLCNTLQHRNTFHAALDCIRGVCKTPYKNRALEMWMTAPLPCTQAGRVAEGQCLLSTRGHRVLHWRSRAEAQHAANTLFIFMGQCTADFFATMAAKQTHWKQVLFQVDLNS